jgi:hypothetical protein
MILQKKFYGEHSVARETVNETNRLQEDRHIQVRLCSAETSTVTRDRVPLQRGAGLP